MWELIPEVVSRVNTLNDTKRGGHGETRENQWLIMGMKQNFLLRIPSYYNKGEHILTLGYNPCRWKALIRCEYITGTYK